MSTVDVIILFRLLSLQKKRSQVTAQPIRSPMTASTAASHTGTLPQQSVVRGWAEVGCVVVDAVVVVKMGKLLSFVKMYGWSCNRNWFEVDWLCTTRSSVAAVLPHWGTWGYFCHLWNCCTSVFYPRAPTRSNRNMPELCSRTDSRLPFASASPCCSTKQQPCQHVLAHWSGNSPERSTWCQAGLPGGSKHTTVCITCPEGDSFCPKAKCLYIWCTSVKSERRRLTVFNGTMVFLKKGWITTAKSSLPLYRSPYTRFSVSIW